MTANTAQNTCAHASDTITVVLPYRWDRTSRTHVRAAATKTYQFDQSRGQWSKISDYDNHTAVSLFTASCTGLAELAGLVQVVGAENGYIVRGDLTEAAEIAMGCGEFCNRRKTRKHPDDQPSLRETARRWLMIDVDDWPIPAHLSLADPADHPLIIDAMIRELCTEPFHDADCWFQWSSSAGLLFDDTAKAHLWFWSDRAESNDHLRRRLMAAMPGVDPAPFNAVQPHYVAPPVLIGGHDPLPARNGWRRGLHAAVSLPEFTPQQIAVMRQANSYGHSTGTWADPLCEVGDDRRRFYTPIRDAIWGYAGIVERGAARNDAKVIDIIQQIVATAVCSPARDIGRYLDAGWLQRMINEAVNKRQVLGGRAAA